MTARAHQDRHRREAALPPSREASVVLDIGGDRGALVVLAPESAAGLEIEIRRPEGAWDGTHTAVRRRDLPQGSCFAGVFGSLPAGDYQARLRGAGTGPVVGLSVTGGEVAQITWPEGRCCRPQGDDHAASVQDPRRRSTASRP